MAANRRQYSAEFKAKIAALPKINRDLDADPSHFKGSDRPVERVS